MNADLLATINGVDLLFFLAGAVIMLACCWPAMRRDDTPARYSEDDLQRRLFDAREDAWDRGWHAHADVVATVAGVVDDSPAPVNTTAWDGDGPPVDLPDDPEWPDLEPQPGTRIADGGIMGTIVVCPHCCGRQLVKDHEGWPFPGEKRCGHCDGDGTLHAPDCYPPTVAPEDGP